MRTGIDEDIRRSARLVNWCTAVASLAVGICLVMLAAGCSGGYRPTARQPAPPDRSVAVATVAGGVGESAGKIDEARADAVAKAPEVQPESERIGEQTSRLRQYQVDLELIAGDLKATKAHVDSLTKSLAGAEKALADSRAETERVRSEAKAELDKVKAEAERERTGLLRWIFGVMAGLSLVGAVAAVLWLKNIPLALTCGGILAACIGATYLLAWAKWLALGVLLLLAITATFAIWRLVRSNRELVLTAEHFKINDPKDKEAMVAAAEAIQSKATKAFVRAVRDPIKKKLAEVKAFGGSL